MMQMGNGYTISYNDGDYESWSEEDKRLFFYLTKEAFSKFHEIKKIQAGKNPWEFPNF